MIIDITQTAKIGKEYREGSSPLTINLVERIDDEGKKYITTNFSCDVHNVGTHIDVVSKDAYISPDRFVGEGIKFDISHIHHREVQLKDLDLSLIKEDVYVFFQSNWDNHLGNDEKYLKHPEISFDVIEYLVSKNVNMIGIDAPGLARGKKHGDIDKYLAVAESYTIENLTNLTKIPASGFKVYCMPMKMEGLDAWPARLLVEV